MAAIFSFEILRTIQKNNSNNTEKVKDLLQSSYLHRDNLRQSMDRT